MKHIIALLIFSCLVLLTIGCESVENPVSDIEAIETTTGNVRGVVQTSDDVPIHVKLIKEGQLLLQMEGDGGFTLRNIEAGSYNLLISAQGYEDTELSVTVVAGETVTVERLILKELTTPKSHIIGLVRNIKTGIRLTDVIVTLTDEEGQQYVALTTNEGIFNFVNLPTLQTLNLTIEHDDYERNDITIKPISADETEKLNIKLTPLGIDDEIQPEAPGEGLPIFTIAPEFDLPDGDSKMHALSDYLEDGKNIVLVFYISGV